MVPIGFLITLGISAALNIILPIVAVVLVRRRLGLEWRYALYGAVIFLLFQLLTRVPAVFALQSLLAQQLQDSRPLQIAWLGGLALSAGLAEEIGRYVGYRWLMRSEEKTWPKAVLYGLGHGGFEAMALVGGLQILTVINLAVLALVDPALLGLTGAQQQQVTAQLRAIAVQPVWLPFVAVWERIWTVCFHTGMSVLVLQAFRRGRAWLWVGLAVTMHFLVNFVGAGAPLLLGIQGTTGTLLSEGIITLFGLGALGLIWRLRDPA